MRRPSNKIALVVVAALLFVGCKTSVNDAVITYGSDSHLQDAVIVAAEMPAYLIGIRTSQGPAILSTGTHEEIRDSAIAAARVDIVAGKPRVARTGGVASSAVGVPLEHLDLVKNLPEVPLPSGCGAPLQEAAATYAEAYNKEMLPYLISRNEVHK